MRRRLFFQAPPGHYLGSALGSSSAGLIWEIFTPALDHKLRFMFFYAMKWVRMRDWLPNFTDLPAGFDSSEDVLPE